jgi:AcrR family transcriptional regulator
MHARTRKRRPRAVVPRVPSEARRRQLLAEAAQLLTEHGAERVQITEVAERAGVSRPLVYRLFPTRQALLLAVLEDFTAFIGQRFTQAVERFEANDVNALAIAFVEASCEAIEQKGAGPWLLLDPRGADPEISRIGRTIFVELLDPWQRQLGTFLGVSQRRASHLLWIITAAGRACLGGWIEGTVTRSQAVSDATRVVMALLQAFSRN